MTEIPKIVHHRLQVAVLGRSSEQAHPDADVLAAFFEQGLFDAERESVLQHLALCAECRDVVTLALPPEQFAPVSVEAEAESLVSESVQKLGSAKPISSRFAWAGLRWAALAAGIAVAVLVVRPTWEHFGNRAAKPAPMPSAPVTAPAQSAANQGASEASAGPAAMKQETAVKPEIPSPHKKIGIVPSPSLADQPRSLIAGTRTSPIRRLSPPPAISSFALSMHKGASVLAASPAMTEVATTSSDTTLMARNYPPAIEKAKPAPEQWIIAAGILQHSVDGGMSWQTSLRTDHLILCYAVHGGEIWAGGQSGTLLRSADNGATWKAVRPFSFIGQNLNSDITQIELRNASEIVLTTADQETWSSTDGGTTWEEEL